MTAPKGSPSRIKPRLPPLALCLKNSPHPGIFEGLMVRFMARANARSRLGSRPQSHAAISRCESRRSDTSGSPNREFRCKARLRFESDMRPIDEHAAVMRAHQQLTGLWGLSVTCAKEEPVPLDREGGWKSLHGFEVGHKPVPHPRGGLPEFRIFPAAMWAVGSGPRLQFCAGLWERQTVGFGESGSRFVLNCLGEWWPTICSEGSQRITAKPGLRIRLKGPPENPTGVGAVIRIESGQTAGPAREVQAGSGYWSQNGAVQVMNLPGPEKAKIVNFLDAHLPVRLITGNAFDQKRHRRADEIKSLFNPQLEATISIRPSPRLPPCAITGARSAHDMTACNGCFAHPFGF
jgi:hypothetical protein